MVKRLSLIGLALAITLISGGVILPPLVNTDKLPYWFIVVSVLVYLIIVGTVMCKLLIALFDLKNNKGNT